MKKVNIQIEKRNWLHLNRDEKYTSGKGYKVVENKENLNIDLLIEKHLIEQLININDWFKNNTILNIEFLLISENSIFTVSNY